MDDSYDAGVAMIRAFNYIKDQEGAAKGMSFITDVSSRFSINVFPLSTFLYTCTLAFLQHLWAFYLIEATLD
jgi:hypothetical protein